MSIRTYLTTLVAMLSVANGHMIMRTPTPYGKSTLNNSPLAADGSDFPCKLRSNTFDAEGASNVMPIGSPQTLSFTGSAVHGGGSCQISLTTDKAPTKDTKWMVIHSIEGGCPASVAGNLPANPDGTDASSFQFSIPSGIAPGEYTLAWTWFNKIGNREMYMNCAPVQVTGGKKRRSPVPQPRPGFTKRADFPDMFIANIAGVSNGCGTTESTDVKFPNPGASVQTVEGSTFAPPTGCTNVQASSGTDTTGSSPSADASPAASSASSPAVESSTATSPTVAPGVFASGASSPSGAAPAVSSVAAEPSAAAPAPVTTAAPSPPAAASTSGSSGAQSGACSDEGAWNCIDGSSFQRCASGAWSATMAMAAGTKCTPGISDTLTMSKRALRFSQPHVRRSHNAWGH